MNIVVLVATHKKYRMPEDPLYLPVQVGAEIAIDSKGKKKELGYQKDNTGDNISSKNSEFSELTAIYWGWKNLDADYIGLVHYRRYFSVRKKGKDPFDNVMTSAEAESILKSHPIIVPKKRKYFIETLESHYADSLNDRHLLITRDIVKEKHPAYLTAYDKVMKRTWGYMFNMMVMRRDYFDAYCQWVFDIVFELENRIDISSYTSFEKRLFGRVSELLFDVWLDYQLDTGSLSAEQIQEVPIISMEPVNWFKKGSAFLAAKLFHKKYKKSF